MNTLLLLAQFLATSLALQATVLWVAVRMCRLPRTGWGRALAISVIRMLVVVGLWSALVGHDGDPTMMLPFTGVALLVDTVLTLWLIRRAFGGGGWRVVGTWAVQAALGVVAGTGMTALILMCLAAYVIPASSMSPNLRGFHVVEVLPDGHHLIHAANDPRDEFPAPGDPSAAIVAETYEYREVTRPARYTAQADRIVCNKTMFPQRWDAVVFKYPRKPDLIYVKRLVGLPGEKLAIRDGAVWINGERLTPPDRLWPIRYDGPVHGGMWIRIPDGDDPQETVLAPDEFFVLGDNTQHSMDSREWGPVPREHILGVADLIYWPPSRWRLRP